ncbi:MAG: hypothetical protein LBC47_10475 [Tannerella sp.]|jgi:hypothetical protein|nr:hypothetical protein [Tannerella sp.]
MTFDDITGDGCLWAVRFEDEDDNELSILFNRWNDVVWLRAFFKSNFKDLRDYYGIIDINTAIEETVDDSEALEDILLGVSSTVVVDSVFRPLNNYIKEICIERQKGRIDRRKGHASWLRVYALKLNQGIFIITGGAIKLTATMQERAHTKAELAKIERVRRFLIENGIVDDAGFEEYINEL